LEKCFERDFCSFSLRHPPTCFSTSTNVNNHPKINIQGFGGYLRSIYFALVAMSTVGYGDIAPRNIVEISFAAVFILIGGLVLPAVVGGISVYILNFGMTAKLFR
jgi:hypothetical protein